MPKIYFFKRSICLMLILSVMICLVSCSKETNTDNQIDTNTDTNIATEIEYDHIGSKSSSGSINLSDKGAEGSATLTVTCIYYEGRDGNQHLKLDEISYEILNSPVFEKVEITYNDGKKTHQLENDKFSDKYAIDADIVAVINNDISATMVIHMTNGKTYTVKGWTRDFTKI
ncbi:MAG: hypothetical protein IJD68_03630 [Ruminococcus sp.]|nr:hypothetical protein [Ruminococcus sp.]